MGMSTNVVGIVPADEKYKQMVAAAKALELAGLGITDEINEFFDWEWPINEDGMVVDINKEAISEYNADMEEGYDIDISKLDPKIKTIRFTNSY